MGHALTTMLRGLANFSLVVLDQRCERLVGILHSFNPKPLVTTPRQHLNAEQADYHQKISELKASADWVQLRRFSLI